MGDKDSYLILEAYEDVKAREAMDLLLRLIPKEKLKITDWDLGHNEKVSDVDVDKVPFTFQDITDSVERDRHSRVVHQTKSLILNGKMTDVKKRIGKKIYFAKVVYPEFQYREKEDGSALEYDFSSPESLAWVIFRISEDGIEQHTGGGYENYSPYYEYRKEDKMQGIDKTNPFI